MFTDLYGYAIKAQIWNAVLDNFERDRDLPSYREARLNIANLERLTQKFKREFSADLLRTMTQEKLRKKRGQFKYRVSQQDKLVDKSIRRLIEDSIVRELQSLPGGQRFTKKKVRGAVQQ